MSPEEKLFWENRPPHEMQALHDVMAERRRQMMVEGWTAKHDNEHKDGAMAVAAACYAATALPDRVSGELVARLWSWTGWAWQWWKPKDKRRNLIRAAALLLAEVERMDRAAECPDHEDPFQHGVYQASRATDALSASGVNLPDGSQR